MISMIISLQILPVVFTLLLMVVLASAGLRHGFQGLDSAHDGMDSDDIADMEDFHHLLSKRSPFFFKLMKFAKKKLNPLTLP